MSVSEARALVRACAPSLTVGFLTNASALRPILVLLGAAYELKSPTETVIIRGELQNRER